MSQVEQLVAQAAQWQAAGRADMAAQLYGAALEQDPSKFAIRMQLAECLAYLGQPDQAAENYLMVAQAYAARGRQLECLAICERIIAIAPHAFLYMSVGPMVRRIGRHAREICAKAAEAHLSAGRQTDGLQILRLGAELDPQNSDVRLQLSRIYLSRHMNREAVEALSDAGNLLIQAKRYTDYIEVAEQILALDPNEIQTLRDLPRVYLELGKPHEAVRTLGLLTRASPGDIIGYEILAQAFASIGRTDKALSVLERLVEELGATGQADKADAIVNHARYWRPTDLGFLRSLKRMEVPRPKPASYGDDHSGLREAAPEGTVVLSIADLVVDEVSRRAPSPGPQESAVQLTEAEGTLTLNIADLVLDEMQQAAGLGISGPTAPPISRRPPPVPNAPPPPPSAKDVPSADSTITLDGADLLEALVEAGATGADPNAVTIPPPMQSAAHDEAPATIALQVSSDSTLVPPSEEARTLAPPGEEARTLVPPGKEARTLVPPGGGPAPRQSISALIYDDEDEDEAEPATMLHMKPLTAEDIARAQQGLQPHHSAPAPAPSDTPEPSIPVGSRPQLMGDDAPTLARMKPLTAADIANAMAQQTASAAVDENEVTIPPSGQIPTPPQGPPLLAPNEQFVPNAETDEGEEEERTVMNLHALTPADLMRERGPGSGDDSG